MRQSATVIETSGDTAIVETDRLQVFGEVGKSSAGSLGKSAFAGDKPCRIFAGNSVNAQVGNRVEIETDTKKLTRFAVLALILPIAAGLAGYFIGAMFSETIALGASFAAFTASFIVLYIYSRQVKRKTVRIIKITERQ